jgi:hypothetical protein
MIVVFWNTKIMMHVMQHIPECNESRFLQCSEVLYEIQGLGGCTEESSDLWFLLGPLGQLVGCCFPIQIGVVDVMLLLLFAERDPLLAEIFGSIDQYAVNHTHQLWIGCQACAVN